MSVAGKAHQDEVHARDMGTVMDLLGKTSRTFALTIPMLPEPTRTEVAVAYLLFRIIDTFEDVTAWSPRRRVQALHEFAALVQAPDQPSRHPIDDQPGEGAAPMAAAGWVKDPPLAHAGYLELLRQTPVVLRAFRRLAPAAVAAIGQHVIRSAAGMAHFVEQADGSGTLQLRTLDELHEYCFVVAGIVGEMLTELFIQGNVSLADRAAELRARARRFGEGLQLVNILKDVTADAVERRAYLPREVPLAEVFMLARADLQAATEYTAILHSGGAHRGVVAFNALNTRLAIATLGLLRDQGPGSKLSRVRVMGLAAEVMSAVDRGAHLFPEHP